MLKVNAKTKLFGVLADPIEHVRAPDIYNERWIYNNKNQLMIPIHVKKENLQSTIEGLRSLSNFYGFCVTIPHKVDVAKYCDKLLPNAEMIGAVNVAYFNKKRELIGNNFDGDGFISGLKSQGYDVKGKRNCGLLWNCKINFFLFMQLNVLNVLLIATLLLLPKSFYINLEESN